jgi:hypothetical protein
MVFFVLEEGMTDESGLHTVCDHDSFRQMGEAASITDSF